MNKAKTLLEVIDRVKKGIYFKFQPELPEIIQIQDIFAMTLVT